MRSGRVGRTCACRNDPGGAWRPYGTFLRLDRAPGARASVGEQRGGGGKGMSFEGDYVPDAEYWAEMNRQDEILRQRRRRPLVVYFETKIVLTANPGDRVNVKVVP